MEYNTPKIISVETCCVVAIQLIDIKIGINKAQKYPITFFNK